MYNQNTRINAAISYCFLWPIFLFARTGTPLAENFVRSHSKKSTLLMVLFGLVLFLLNQLQSFLQIFIFGISLYQIIFSLILAIFLGIFLLSAYRAYQWIEANKVFSFVSGISRVNAEIVNYSEEQKIQIFMAFLPFVGTFVSAKNPMLEVQIARKIANFFLFLLILTSILFQSTITILGFAILMLYIAIFVATGVFLLVQSRFLHFKMYDFIPSYHQIEAKIATFLFMMKEYFFIAFGRKKTTDFATKYQQFLEKFSLKIPPQEKFWIHPMIIGIPILNIITIPSFFQKKYHEYQGNIAEGFLLTIFVIVWFFFVKNIYILYLLVFPIIALVAYSNENTNVRAPIVSVARAIFIFFYRAKHTISDLKNFEQVESFQFQNAENNQKNNF